MHFLQLTLVIYSALSLAWSAASWAVSDNNTPWAVESDSYEILLEQREITYVGNVVAEQGEYRIKADRLRAYFNENNELIRMEADGTESLQAEMEALNQEQVTRLLGDHLLYDMHADRVIAKGHTKLFRGQDTMDAHELIYNLTEERVVALRSDEARVRVIMFPEAAKPPATAD